MQRLARQIPNENRFDSDAVVQRGIALRLEAERLHQVSIDSEQERQRGRMCCAAAGFGKIGRNLSRLNAWLEVAGSGYRYDLVTCTRTEWSHPLPESVAAFRSAVSALMVELEQVGALAWTYFLEAVPKPELTEVGCCGERGCILCNGTGIVTAAHLHAHAVVISRPGTRYPYSGVQRLEVPRLFDPLFGNVDFQKGHSPDVSKALRYIAKYAAKGADESRAWLSRAGAKRISATGGDWRGQVETRSYWSTERAHIPGIVDAAGAPVDFGEVPVLTRVYHVTASSAVDRADRAVVRSKLKSKARYYRIPWESAALDQDRRTLFDALL